MVLCCIEEEGDNMTAGERSTVKNLFCVYCTDDELVRQYGPRRSSGHVVSPTLMPEFAPNEALKPGWRLALTLHGRYEQTDVYSMDLLLGSVVRLDVGRAFRLTYLTTRSNWYRKVNECFVLGTVSHPGEHQLALIKPGIRAGEFLVFGDQQGMICSVTTMPIMHILAEYYSVIGS